MTNAMLQEMRATAYEYYLMHETVKDAIMAFLDDNEVSPAERSIIIRIFKEIEKREMAENLEDVG